METRLLSSVSEIDPTDWNSIVGRDRLICRHEFLLSVEQSGINDCRFFYPVVYEGGRIVAHTCLYSISTELDTFAKGSMKKIITGIRRNWKSFMVLRTIECGTPVALGTTLSFAPECDRLTALSGLIEATELLAERERIGVVICRDFAEEDADFDAPFRSLGYRRVRNLPTTHLRIAWKSFDEYLRSMTRKYRAKILAQRRKFVAQGGVLEVKEEFSAYSEECQRLWRNAYDNAKEYRREMLSADFFENVNRNLPGRCMMILAKVNRKLAGFFLVLRDDATLRPLFCGLDYEISRQCFAYFNLHYRTIEMAISDGFKSVDMGITTLQPKIEMGAEVEPLFMYMKHRRPFLNVIVPRVFDVLLPRQSVRWCHVFQA